MNRMFNKDRSLRHNPQNKQRARARGNRKSAHSLQRSYESNGPNVKIRGNAAQVAEKYLALARDAHVSSDRILAENYTQHAEHYFRLLAAAQQSAQQAHQTSGGQSAREAEERTEHTEPPQEEAAMPQTQSKASQLNGLSKGQEHSAREAELCEQEALPLLAEGKKHKKNGAAFQEGEVLKNEKPSYRKRRGGEQAAEQTVEQAPEN